MIKTLHKLLVYTILSTVLGCASRIPPDGGAKDSTPPSVLSSNPPQKTVNIRPDKVEFVFDEFIELKDGGSGILISPPMILMPDIQLKGKSVILKMRQPFDVNTTYTISIGGAIKDITESNLLEPYSLVFSSGPLLDSLVVTGRVVDAFTNAPLKDALVMLYLSDVDSLPKKQLPRYFTQSNESGSFKIENVKAGFYSIFALKDANKNYKYDQPGELIGFQEKMFQVDSNTVSVSEIRMSAETPEKQRLIKSSYHLPSTLILKYALPANDIILNDMVSGTSIPFFKNPGSTEDSLILSLPTTTTDSLNLYVSVNSNHLDTILIKTKRVNIKSSSKKARSTVDTSFTFTSNIDKGKLLPTSLLELKSSFPSKYNYGNNVFWIVEKDTIPAELEPKYIEGFTWQYVSIPPKNPGKSIKFLATKGAFEDLYGRSSDSLRFDFRQMDAEEAGNVELLILDSIVKPGIDLVLQFIDAKKKLVKSQKVKNGDLVVFSELSPGTYNLRIIEDANGNGIWDSGIFSSRQQAENIIYYKESLSVRAGWDLAIDWDVNSKIPTGMLKQKK